MRIYCNGLVVNKDYVDEGLETIEDLADLRYLEVGFNTRIQCNIIPDLNQCGAFTNNYKKEDGSFDIEKAKSEVFDDNEEMTEKLTENWKVFSNLCDDEDDGCEVEVDDDMKFTLTPLNQFVMSEGYSS